MSAAPKGPPPAARPSRSEAETFALGEALGATLRAGEIVSLEGELGAGKTVFARGIAAALGIDPREVGSPTFIIVDRHEGRLVLYHADLYRLDREEEVLDLGLDELAAQGAVLAVEWGERLPADLHAAAIVVRISDPGENDRAITIARPDGAGAGPGPTGQLSTR
jgi:tRNA threonylcarbamoyladenosine biosynthesis protein TsaE